MAVMNLEACLELYNGNPACVTKSHIERINFALNDLLEREIIGIKTYDLLKGINNCGGIESIDISDYVENLPFERSYTINLKPINLQ